MSGLALVLDTSVLSGAERAQAFHAALGAASVPTLVRHRTREADVLSRMHFTRLGRCEVFSAAGSGFSLHRTSRHVRLPSADVVSLSVQRRGDARLEQDHLGRTGLGRGDLFITDLTSPYDYHQPGTGDVVAFQLELGVLDLPVETVRAAAPRLASSPLHAVVRHQLGLLEAAAEEVEGTPAAALLGESTLLLFRALITSVGGHDARPVLSEVLFERIAWYVQQHLADPGLSAAQVAAAHHVSVRSLYAVLAARDLTLRRWLLEQRLAGARAELAGPGRRPVAAVARAWGFPDPGHFSRRFREAYGTTPVEWRRSCGPSPG